MDSKKGITVAGSLIADVFYEIDTYPKEGYLIQVRSSSLNPGGSGNMILDLAKMDKDLNVKVCAIVGTDERGAELLKILGKYPNIDTENITVEGNSSITMVMNAKDTKQRTFFFIPEASDKFDDTYINWDTIDTKIFQLEYILLMKQMDSLDSEFGTKAAKVLCEAKKRGMITSIDIVSEQSDRAKTIVTSALKYTDICCINECEAEAVTGVNLTESFTEENVLKAIEIIRGLGVSKWIVIHAPKMAYGFDCDTKDFVCLRSLNLPKDYIKGTTGAGDAYCSGILYGAHEDKTIKDAMRIARATASCSLSENNGSDGIKDIKEIMLLEEKFCEL